MASHVNKNLLKIIRKIELEMVNKNISKIYLASKSPRRRELLSQMGQQFEVLAIDIPEEVAFGEDYLAYSRRICREKAEAGWNHIFENSLAVHPVLTADTEVVHNGEVLGKPANYDAAFKMWQRLQNDRHLVITSLTLKYEGFCKTLTRESWVHFDAVSDEEIHHYLATGDYKDKSGSYGIQSYAGQFIKKIDGCFYSIMGLPLNAIRQLLQELASNAD